MREDTLCALYTGRCSACGHEREYMFVLGPEIVSPDAFGGAIPSTIIDAGQYLAASERAARQMRPVGPLEDRASARASLGLAIACLDEVMKWIPPSEESVPPSAFFTEEGLRVHADEPGRFRRTRLAAVLAAYREMWVRMS